jgi:uncharacterized protein (TIRG00374 family)
LVSALTLQSAIKRWLSLILGLLISIGALALALRQANISRVAEALQAARYEYVLACAAMIVLATLIRGWRWSTLTGGRLSTIDGFFLFNTGFLFNNVLPARLGEPVRAYLAGRHPGMHFTSALSSIIVERLFDMVSVVVLIGGLLLALPLPDWATAAGGAMGLLALAGIVLLAIAARAPDFFLRVGSRVLGWIPRLSEERAQAFLRPYVDGLAALKSWRVFFEGLGLSLAAWALSCMAGWVLMFTFWESVPLRDGFLAIAAAGLGISVPGAPSGIGPFEAAVTEVLTYVGYAREAAVGYAFVMHAANIAMTSIIGVIGLLREGVSFQEALQGIRQQQGT